MAAALAGPALIVASILVALRRFVFAGLISAQHPDLLSQWLPVHCYLGRSLAQGNIPEWNPYVMGGAPFAADPQSGWMNFPAMTLYSNLPCDTALGWYIAVLPLIAGLGLYAWLRVEGLSRVAATTSGLALGLGVASSRLVLSLPFSGVLAWTAVALAFAAGYVRARTGAGRVLFAVFTALAWGQAAAVHLSHGLVMTTLALVIYLIARSLSEEHQRRRGGRLAFVALPLLALPLVNLAYLVPRIAYLPRTTLAIGYDGLDAAAARLSGLPLERLADQWALDASWLGHLGTSPGTYLGAVTVVLALGAFRSRHRSVVVAVTAFGALCFVASLVLVADALTPFMARVPFGDFYLHAPGRFSIGALFALSALAGFGLDAWRAEPNGRRRAAQLGAGAVGAGVLVGLSAPEQTSILLPVAGLVAGLGLLAAAHRRPLVLLGLPLLLVVELSAGQLIGQTSGRDDHKPVMFSRLQPPYLSTSEYLTPGPIVRALAEHPGARYLSFDPTSLGRRGYLEKRDRESWGLLSDQSSMLFGVEDAQGYNPAQPRRYWRIVRAANTKPIKYNSAVLTDPSTRLLDLLGIEFIVARSPDVVDDELEPVVSQPPWKLFRRSNPGDHARLFTEWTIEPDRKLLMRSLARGETDSTETLLLDADPGIAMHDSQAPSAADYQRSGDEAARIEVDAPHEGVLVVRNSFDPNWRATIDGVETPVFAAQYLWTGVKVPSGSHSVVLVYQDPYIEYGLLGTGLSLLAAALAIAALSARRLPRLAAQPKNTSAVS